MDERKGPGVEVSFIDVLFAVVLGIGLEAIVKEPWLRNHHGFARREFWTFVLAGVVVIGSWLGYHGAMKDLGGRIAGVRQFFRFCIDICLLFEYARILERFDDLNFVLFQIAVIFGWYLLWDLVSYGEWGGAHWRVSLAWCFFSLLLWWLAAEVRQPATQQRAFVILGVSIASIVVYRLVPPAWYSKRLPKKV